MPDIYVDTPLRHRAPPKRGFAGQAEKKQKKRHPYHEAGALAAYAFHPDNIHFENQGKDEEIVLFLRQHPIVNVPWIIVAIILLAGPVVLLSFPLLDFLPNRFQLVSILVWYLLTLAFVFEQFLGWLFNIYIITNTRVVDIDFLHLTYREVSDTGLKRIQDVTFRQGGVVRTLFNYGDVLIQTAGALPNFDFLAVPNPGEVTRILQDLRHGRLRQNEGGLGA